MIKARLSLSAVVALVAFSAAALFLCVPSLRAAFEESAVGARSSAMGGSFSALSGGADSLCGNPALLSLMTSPRLDAGYSRLHAGLSDGSDLARASLAFGYPYGFMALGAGYDSLSLAGVYDESTVSLGWSAEFIDGISLGVAARRRAIGIAKDAYTVRDPVFEGGDYSRAFSEYTAGAAARFGGFVFGVSGGFLGESYEVYKDPPPVTAGVSYSENGFVFAADYSVGRTKSVASLGFEKYFLGDIFALRGGFAFGGRDWRRASAGFGARVGEIGADYALEYPLSGISGVSGTHRFTFSARFASPKSPPREKPAAVPRESPRARSVEKPSAPPPPAIKTDGAVPQKTPATPVEVATGTETVRPVKRKSEMGAWAPPAGKIIPSEKPPSASISSAGLPPSLAVASSPAAPAPAVDVSTSVLPAVISTDAPPVPAVEAPPPAAPPAPAAIRPASPGGPPPAARTHKVAPGETPASVAEKYYGSPSQWFRIYRANEDKIEKGILKTGEVLIIP